MNENRITKWWHDHLSPRELHDIIEEVEDLPTVATTYREEIHQMRMAYLNREWTAMRDAGVLEAMRNVNRN